MNAIKIIECPRDAMQGWQHWISTEQKIDYINTLLQVGFDTIDFGSYVSAKAIPQLRDTAAVLENLKSTSSSLLAIVANQRGAESAVLQSKINYIGYPFSVSPTFQQRNTGSSQQESIATLNVIQKLCADHDKKLVVYLSMGFGNPYGDAYSKDVLLHWADVMASGGIQILALADTVGLAQPQEIGFALQTLQPQYREIEFGVHLHSTPKNWEPKIEAAYEAGCRRFDSAILGIGGCPMAGDALVGNMATEWLLSFFDKKGVGLTINQEAWRLSLKKASLIFAGHGMDAET